VSKIGLFISRIPLRNLIFLLLLGSGLIPLLAASIFLTRRNVDLFETQEQTFLTRSAESLSEEIGTALATLEREVRQLGEGFLALPGPDSPLERLRLPGVERYFGNLLDNEGSVLQLQVLDLDGSGPTLGAGEPDAQVQRALRETFAAARKSSATTYRFVRRASDNEPLAVAAVPVFVPEAQGEAKVTQPVLILQAVSRLDVLGRVGNREARGDVAVFLIDSDGRVLWERGADDETARALASSRLVDDFRRGPEIVASEYTIFTHGRKVRMLGRVSPVEQTGWGIVVQKPLSAAYTAVQQLLYTTIIASLLLVALSGIFAGFAASRFSAPFTRLTASTHAIAAGQFGDRVEVSGPGREVVELAEDFNRMSGHVQSYVEQLQQAAQANRELFIGSIRAFAAAVDAKDPYTRGHSERVAAFSRTIARTLGQSPEFQERIWIAGVLLFYSAIWMCGLALLVGVSLVVVFVQGEAAVGARIDAYFVRRVRLLGGVLQHRSHWQHRAGAHIQRHDIERHVAPHALATFMTLIGPEVVPGSALRQVGLQARIGFRPGFGQRADSAWRAPGAIR